MAKVCNFRIFTAPSGGLTGMSSLGVGLGDQYFSIPLASKSAYAVANDTKQNLAFTIQAFTYDEETGKSVHQGALPTLIRQAMAGSTIRISSATGKVYVNMSVKPEREHHTLHALLKGLPFGRIAGGLSMISGLWEVAQPEPKELLFSISARETETTQYSFQGEKTLNEINIALWRRKAFAFAEPSNSDKAKAVVGALAEGLGGTEGPVGDLADLTSRLL